MYKQAVVSALREGRLAVQVLACDDYVITGTGVACPLWNADPWELIGAQFPARVRRGGCGGHAFWVHEMGVKPAAWAAVRWNGVGVGGRKDGAARGAGGDSRGQTRS